MLTIILVLIAIISLMFPLVRCAIIHPVSVAVNGFQDARRYLTHRDWNVASYGQISCYIADSSVSFGCGKTLSATDYLVSLFRRYNNRPVWCGERHKMVTQKVKIISNVDFLTIPYERLVSLAQFVQWSEQVHDYDMEHDTLTVTYMLIDEASSQLNSRMFKSNFDPYFISRLLTSRHARASIVLTSQRAGMVDKLMRDCTHLYIGCRKIWRFQLLSYYDAYEMETAQNPALVAPLRRTCWFVHDGAFANYDTYANVESLKKSCKAGDMLSESEIVALQAGPDPSMDGVLHPSRRWRRRQSRK